MKIKYAHHQPPVFGNMGILYNIKHALLQSSNATDKYLSKIDENISTYQTCTRMFTARGVEGGKG